MCGIAGFADFRNLSSKEILIKMTDELYHRGPDDSGYEFYRSDIANIGIGHRRLSILDLSNHGHQPMSFKHLTIAYNGEVYNFQEIRSLLEKSNYTFQSHSDTEVILKAYHKWGIEAINMFNGMFSIVILDSDAKKLTLIRDRAGVKPMYWYFKDNLFMFSSELKSFHQHPNFHKSINLDALSLYFQYGYILEPYSIFKDTHKLSAGHYLTLCLKTQSVKKSKYWDVLDYYNKPKLSIDENDAIEKTERLLLSASEYRMIADVPVGIFLSGGYDSSMITALLQKNRTQKLKTFSIGFHQKEFNEAHHAKKVAKYLGTDHTEYYCTQKDVLDLLPKVSKIWDEPFADSSMIPTTLVSFLARQKVTVSLSADGGDEVFGGYDKYLKFHEFKKTTEAIPFFAKNFFSRFLLSSHLRKFGFSYAMLNKLKKLGFILSSTSASTFLKTVPTVFNIDILKAKTRYIQSTNFGIQANKSFNDLINQLLAIDYKTFMVDDILTKVDRATMSVSLEGREPLLDQRIIELVAQFPTSLKIRNKEKKWLLKQIAHKHIPKEMLNRPKQGFDMPITFWLKDELSIYVKHYLDHEKIKKQGILDEKVVTNICQYFLNRNHRRPFIPQTANRIWRLIVFELWHEKWMK